MAKQPKYFLSNSKPLKPQSLSLNQPEQPVAAPPPVQTVTPRSFLPYSFSAVARFGVLGLGLATLTGLSVLVGVSSGLINPSRLRGDLPVLFPKPVQGSVSVAQSHPGIGQGLSFDIQTADARIEIVRSFLERYKSPLTPYEQYATALVQSADRYGLDYRLLPAIMMQESNLCKTSDPKLHNCLGFGIHARGTLGFDSYEEGFDRAARELKENYIDQGLTTPAQIMRKYTPSSNGSWEASVNQWIAEMEHNDREIGKTASADANLLEYTAKK